MQSKILYLLGFACLAYTHDVHDHEHDCDHHDDHDHDVDDTATWRVKKVAESPEFDTDYVEGNLHHKYVDVDEIEEEDGSDSDDDSEEEELIVLPKEWPKLLNFPEIRSKEQLEALTADPAFR